MKTLFTAFFLFASLNAFAESVEFYNDEAAFRCVIKKDSFDEFKVLKLEPMTSDNLRSLFIEDNVEPISETCQQNSNAIICNWVGNRLVNYTLTLQLDSAKTEVSSLTQTEVVAVMGLIAKTGSFKKSFTDQSRVTCYQDI